MVIIQVESCVSLAFDVHLLFQHFSLQSLSSEAKVTDHKRERNGEIDYKKVCLCLTSFFDIHVILDTMIWNLYFNCIFQLYEESQQANTRLKDDLEKLSNENAVSKKKLEDAMKVFLHIIKIQEFEFLLVLVYKNV